MAHIRKRALSSLLSLALLLSLSGHAFAAAPDSAAETALASTAQYIYQTVTAPQVGSTGGEWAVLGLARSGYDVPEEYYQSYYAAVEAYVKDCGGVLHEKKYTEYSRVVLALTAIGADPSDVAGYDLLMPLGDFDKTVWQGVNGPIWALIALDSGNYDIPADPQAATQATRQLYIDEILSRQLDGGGWNLTDKGGYGQADPDVTGMVLQALAKYQDQPKVKAACDGALSCLSAMQLDDGSYASEGAVNVESVAQVIVGLLELGVSLDDPRFVKNGCTLVDALLSFHQSSGEFLHSAGGTGSNLMASEQGLYALAAVCRAQKGLSTLYRMDDVTAQVSGELEDPGAGLPGKHPDVRPSTVTAPDITFDDIAIHENRTAIEALASRGIVTGKDGGVFDPNANMTRAEFAAIVVRALGLTPQENDRFSDVKHGDWFAGYIGTASDYGLIQGVGDGRFDPDGSITRQEAAVMAARAAKLCGMDTEMDAAAVRDVLAQFSDYVQAPAWARMELAFCYDTGILDDSVIVIKAEQLIQRCEVAQMLFQLLSSAQLL